MSLKNTQFFKDFFLIKVKCQCQNARNQCIHWSILSWKNTTLHIFNDAQGIILNAPSCPFCGNPALE